MPLCRLFHCLSDLVWDAIERSYSYSHQGSEGVQETSITDFLLSVIHLQPRRRCVVYVPQEVFTGADLDLILMGQRTKGAHFRMQAKKLKRNETYSDLNRRNNNGYQADLLCSDPGFYPLYLFYNRYDDPSSSSDRMRLGMQGCAIASGRRVKHAINPGPNGNNVLGLDALISLQDPWWVLVCPSDTTQGTPAARARAAARRLGNIGASPDHPAEPDDTTIENSYRELDGVYRALWEAREGTFRFVEGIGDVARPVIILSE